MTKNPFVNALLASGYISVVASAMYYAPKYMEPVDAVIVPVTVLSLFVLSAAMMGRLQVHIMTDGPFYFFISRYKCILMAQKKRR